MSKKCLIVIILTLHFLLATSAISATVIDFEDLSSSDKISGTDYKEIYWEFGNIGAYNNQGYWLCASSNIGSNSYPSSGINNIVNGYGCTLIGMQFSEPVNVIGAYFAGQTDRPTNWAQGIIVHGYLNDIEVASTDLFSDIDTHPDWFQMNLQNVDSIVIESIPYGSTNVGYYGMDDLTFEVPEPATLSLLAVGGLTLLRKRK